MNNRRGNALLVVTLLSVGMVLTAMGLVSLTGMNQKTSYALNTQVVSRYAAEAEIEEVKTMLAIDKTGTTAITVGTWFIPRFQGGLSASDLNAYNANPTSGPYIAVRPAYTRNFGNQTSAASAQYMKQMRVDVYFDKSANANEYIARVVSYPAAEGWRKNNATLKMNFSYQRSQAAPSGLGFFSKYALFMDRWDDSLWFSHERYDGFVHSNEDVQFMYSDFRAYRELTYVDDDEYYWNPTQAQINAMFPGGKRRTSEVPMPSFNDIQTDIQPVAASGDPKLYVDRNQPGPWQGLNIDKVRVTFAWDNANRQNIAYIQALNNSGNVIKTVKYDVPRDGTDTLIYTDKPVQVKGVIQGRVSVATTASSSSVGSPSRRFVASASMRRRRSSRSRRPPW